MAVNHSSTPQRPARYPGTDLIMRYEVKSRP